MSAIIGFNFSQPEQQVKTSNIIISDRFSAFEAISFQENFKLLCLDYKTPEKFILDFSKTRFIDSSGIGALVKSIKLSKENNIKIEVVNVSDQVYSVLKMTGLEQLLSLDNNIEKEKVYDKKLIPETHPSVRSLSKRFIDITGSIVGLGITAVLFIPVAIAIKLESPGPLLFSQTRMGWLGSHFKLYKFRTMVNDAETRKNEVQNEAEGAIFKCTNDPRITRVGKFLRKTSLDELPQFWNVLQGSMSMVGTRPPTPDEVEQYHVPQWQRLNVKPGITGEWQVNGRSNVKKFEDIIQMDLTYQKNWSLFYDLKLIVKTVFVIFSKNSGAM